MANKFYQVKKTINGTEYTAQFCGISTSLRALDESYIEGTSNTSMEKMAKFLFDHIIVEPKGLAVDDFDSMDEFNAVVKFATGVMKGEFRAEAITGEAKAKG
jgi:hypothetical protein